MCEPLSALMVGLLLLLQLSLSGTVLVLYKSIFYIDCGILFYPAYTRPPLLSGIKKSPWHGVLNLEGSRTIISQAITN